MDQTKCRVCGSSFYDHRLVYKNMPKAAQNFPDNASLHQDKGDTLVIGQCSGCEIVQSMVFPVEYHRDVIRSTAFSKEMKHFRLNQFKELDLSFNFSKKRTIEIGSGCGEYMHLMKESGWKIWGVEHLDQSVQTAIESGLRVQQGYLETENYLLNEGPFSAFVCFNFLEHIPNINTFLSAIAINIEKNSLGIIEVPNFDIMLTNSMSTEFIADHLYYFTEKTIRRTLEINGFDVLRSQIIWHDYIISLIVKKRCPLSFQNFTDQDRVLQDELKEYLNKRDRGRVAIWGAGHQALATIVISNISNRVEYLIDSAPFKQNKYTPATHLPIFAPDILDRDPVDTILVMAAGYSDEVVTLITSQYMDRFQLAILRDSGLEVLH